MPVPELLPSRVLSDPFAVFRRDMDSLFDDFSRTNTWPARETRGVLFPTLNVSENNECFRITADLPGLERKDVTLALEENRLVLSGSRSDEKEEKGRNWFRKERVSGEFRRAVEFPCEIDAAKATAAMKDGVLTIDLPKMPAATNRRRVLDIKQA